MFVEHHLEKESDFLKNFKEEFKLQKSLIHFITSIFLMILKTFLF